MSVKALTTLVCSTDALAQVCQDMYSTYVDFISAQASFLLSQKVLQPQQLTESYLAGISGECTLYQADVVHTFTVMVQE